MNSQWNTRQFSKKLGASLCRTLREISAIDQILVVQSEVIGVLGELLTFSQLTSSSPVRKILVLGDQTREDLNDILSTKVEMELVFLIDVRSDLCLPKELISAVNDLKMQKVNVVYCTWEYQVSNDLLKRNAEDGIKLSHFIKSQLPGTVDTQLYPWNMLGFPQIDDNVLLCNLLYNSEGQNMFSPNVFSMQSATRAILIDNMANCLQALFQETHSTITHAVAFGSEAQKLLNLLRQRIVHSESEEDAFIKDTLYGDKYSGIERDLIVFDREMDPMTPLLTQLTYSGLLDDLYELTPEGKVKDLDDVILRYDKDDIWDDLKFLNFGALGPQLNRIARELQDKYDARHKAESVGEIKQFVESLGSLQERQKLLKVHTTLSSDILQEVEKNESAQFNRILELEQDLLLGNLSNKSCCDSILDLLYEGEVGLKCILRLMCLFSICKNGLRDKDYEFLKKELIDTFGIEVCFTLENLALAGLFTNKTLSSRHYNTIWKREYHNISAWLGTMPPVDDDTREVHNMKSGDDAANPKDATFAYCGVVPIVTRFIQLLYDRSVVSKNYASQQPYIISREPSIAKTEELFEQIYGKTGTVMEESWLPEVKKNKRRVSIGKGSAKINDIAIVVFLGGVTLGEIATLRYLQDRLREKGVNKRFIIVSDGLINGNRYIDSSDSQGGQRAKLKFKNRSA